ncbi:hypothetical protein BC827DRAFT_528756 [Russula dissimulans]|nr:hypothetical protein BC827DRAFT_528756 [Russula dissimulans]
MRPLIWSTSYTRVSSNYLEQHTKPPMCVKVVFGIGHRKEGSGRQIWCRLSHLLQSPTPPQPLTTAPSFGSFLNSCSMRSIYNHLPFMPNLLTPKYVPPHLLSLVHTLPATPAAPLGLQPAARRDPVRKPAGHAGMHVRCRNRVQSSFPSHCPCQRSAPHCCPSARTSHRTGLRTSTLLLTVWQV